MIRNAVLGEQWDETLLLMPEAGDEGRLADRGMGAAAREFELHYRKVWREGQTGLRPAGVGDSRKGNICSIQNGGTHVEARINVDSGAQLVHFTTMAKPHNEVRDPVHVFIHYDASEAAVINAAPFQRLRSIHQLALSYLVYPGATHKRFEHSLGVMEIATRIFDVVTRPDKLKGFGEDVVPPDRSEFHYWRKMLRVAALCHDLGHLPFSHAAEEALLPDGDDHESLTRDIIHSDYLSTVWDDIRPKPEPDDVVKLALGPEKVEKLRLGLSFTPWEAILAEMITGDVFGADRIDYLLRDSLHTGVAYGRFDHNRLIDTLRIIPGAPEGGDGGDSEAQLGCERGGLESAEALMLARYFMFAQVYYHRTRLAYDEHLKDFLSMAAGRRVPDRSRRASRVHRRTRAERDQRSRPGSGAPGHTHEARILNRGHFREAYRRQPDDVGARSLATEAIAAAAATSARTMCGTEGVPAGMIRLISPCISISRKVCLHFRVRPIGDTADIERRVRSGRALDSKKARSGSPSTERRSSRRPWRTRPERKRWNSEAARTRGGDRGIGAAPGRPRQLERRDPSPEGDVPAAPTLRGALRLRVHPLQARAGCSSSATARLMRADRLLERQAQPAPYGPKVVVTDRGLELEQRFARTMSKYSRALEWVADQIGARGVAELERLATALWVTDELGEERAWSSAAIA